MPLPGPHGKRAVINLGDPDARLIVTRSPPENARLLARGELPLGRTDLSARQSFARIPAEARTYQTRLLGHWGTTPGLNFLYVHLNRLIKENDLNMMYIIGRVMVAQA